MEPVVLMDLHAELESIGFETRFHRGRRAQAESDSSGFGLFDLFVLRQGLTWPRLASKALCGQRITLNSGFPASSLQVLDLHIGSSM